MIIYSSCFGKKYVRVVVVFGVGLVGNSICSCIDNQKIYKKSILKFNWNNRREAESNSNSIYNYLSNMLVFSSSNVSLRKVAFIWSAGKAGFGASEKEMLDELENYNIVLKLANKVAELPIVIDVFFHHFSSAGGLFEGQDLIDKYETPSPLRVYGQIKYEQEKGLAKCGLFSVINIYRPTSVYGFLRKNCRFGLIQALLSNGIKNQVTTIFGNLNTLRDYVLNEDISKYVCMKLFDESLGDYSIFFLGGGKPSSIYEVKYMIENSIGKKLYVEYKENNELANDKDIVISKAVMPNDWYPTTLQLGIDILKKEALFR